MSHVNVEIRGAMVYVHDTVGQTVTLHIYRNQMRYDACERLFCERHLGDVRQGYI